MSINSGAMKAKSDTYISEHIDPKVLDSIWSKTLESKQILQTPVFIDSVNEKSPTIIESIRRSSKRPPIVIGRIGLNSTGKLPGVTINNNGSNADFTLGNSKIAFDQKTGSISFSDPLYPSGGKETISTLASALEYARTIEDKLAIKNAIINKKPFDIMFDGSKKLTLYPAKDGVHIAKAVVTWSERDKDFEKGYMIYKSRYVENSVTIDNLSGGGSLKITPKQYYVDYKKPSYIPYLLKQNMGQHGL
jgi:hypothetical protein